MRCSRRSRVWERIVDSEGSGQGSAGCEREVRKGDGGVRTCERSHVPDWCCVRRVHFLVRIKEGFGDVGCCESGPGSSVGCVKNTRRCPSRGSKAGGRERESLRLCSICAQCSVLTLYSSSTPQHGSAWGSGSSLPCVLQKIDSKVVSVGLCVYCEETMCPCRDHPLREYQIM